MDSIADENIFSELYRRYYGMAFGIALRILRNVEDAEDVAQDSFERVYITQARKPLNLFKG